MRPHQFLLVVPIGVFVLFASILHIQVSLLNMIKRGAGTIIINEANKTAISH